MAICTIFIVIELIRDLLLFMELQTFVRENERPTFLRFVKQNKENMVYWSVPLSSTTATALHGIWYERFKQVVNSLDEPRR